MTLHYHDVNSFKWVEQWYKRIRPVNERDHGTERNIRPMDARYRKWERLHKFSDNCYGIFDGSWGDPYGWRVRYHSEQEGFNAEMLTVAEIKKLCPILWTRHRDGTETIKIRNGTGRGKHIARYSLLERYLPYKLQLRKENGMQYIRNLDQGTTHYLAKSRTVPAYEFTIKGKWGGRTWFEREKFTPRDDGAALTFRRGTDGKFTYLSGGKAVPTRPRTVVNKSKKAKLKPHINEFWEYVCAIGAMLPTEDWTHMRAQRRELLDYAKGLNPNKMVHISYYIMGQFKMPASAAIRLLKEHDNELRLNLAAVFVQISDFKLIRDDEDVKRVRAQYNQFINHLCGLTKIVR